MRVTLQFKFSIYVSDNDQLISSNRLVSPPSLAFLRTAIESLPSTSPPLLVVVVVLVAVVLSKILLLLLYLLVVLRSLTIA